MAEGGATEEREPGKSHMAVLEASAGIVIVEIDRYNSRSRALIAWQPPHNRRNDQDIGEPSTMN